MAKVLGGGRRGEGRRRIHAVTAAPTRGAAGRRGAGRRCWAAGGEEQGGGRRGAGRRCGRRDPSPPSLAVVPLGGGPRPGDGGRPPRLHTVPCAATEPPAPMAVAGRQGQLGRGSRWRSSRSEHGQSLRIVRRGVALGFTSSERPDLLGKVRSRCLLERLFAPNWRP